MLRVCGWCGIQLDLTQDKYKETEITHGICSNCAFHLRAATGMEFEDYLNHLPHPVIVIDDENKVTFCNTQAVELLHTTYNFNKRILCGKVFECENSFKPQGCGKTQPCHNCSIKRAIDKTRKNNISLEDIVVELHREDAIYLLNISTEILSHFIILRINSMVPKP